jgi:GMP synthase (glutamine-hydrolysing)
MRQLTLFRLVRRSDRIMEMEKGKKQVLPVLLIQHAPYEHPAVIRRALESQGTRTLTIHPYRGDLYPSRTDIAGVISLGGSMHANDDERHPWIPKECALLRECVLEGMPSLGICLGGQLMARGLGGRVEKNEIMELGWFPIHLNAAGKSDPIMASAGSSPTVYHWHEDTFHLPTDATLLAYSKGCPRQAYRIGEKAYGFQFHPEADHQLLHEWLSYEGIEEEIAAVKKTHGARTVQDAKTQRGHALRGEKSSLKITAAFSGLFRTRPRLPENKEAYELFESWTTHRTALALEFEGPLGRTSQIRGQILGIFTISAGDFVLFQEENTLVWPIRMEDILRVLPLS